MTEPRVGEIHMGQIPGSQDPVVPTNQKLIDQAVELANLCVDRAKMTHTHGLNVDDLLGYLRHPILQALEKVHEVAREEGRREGGLVAARRAYDIARNASTKEYHGRGRAAKEIEMHLVNKLLKDMGLKPYSPEAEAVLQEYREEK